MISGLLNDEDEKWVRTLLEEKEMEIKTPKEAIDDAVAYLSTK